MKTIPVAAASLATTMLMLASPVVAGAAQVTVADPAGDHDDPRA